MSDVLGVAQVRPGWLRPGALVVVIGLHICAVTWLALRPMTMPLVPEGLEITIAQGVQKPEPAPPPPEPPPPEPEPPPPEPPPPEPVVEPPPPPEPEPPLPEPPPPEPPKRVVASAPALPPPKPKPPKPRPPEPPPSEAPPPKPVGATDARDLLTQAKATYAGKIAQAARAYSIEVFATGSVRVAFTIDANGDVTDVSVIESSGRSELDRAALRTMRNIRPGPPPDGPFSGTIRIRFNER